MSCHHPSLMNISILAQREDLAIRRMRDDLDDYERMPRWLTDRRVLEFYEGRDNPLDLPRVRDKFGPHARAEDHVVPCIFEFEGRAIGYMQYYPVLDGSEYEVEDADGVYGVDLFIGESNFWDRGIGTRAVTLLVEYLLGEIGAVRVVIDPAVTNARAIRCYEKSGFRKVKVLLRHELHEGTRRECWLMVRDP